MKKALMIIIFFILQANGVIFAEPSYKPKPEIQSYVDFLHSKDVLDPKDYIFSLFDKYDIVIIAETDHRETTQWDFIYSLISDPRFIEKVGNLFTEYGSVYLQPQLDNFLNKPTLDNEAILQMLHSFMPNPEGWDHDNIYNFMQHFYMLNQSLPAAQKIHWYFSDEPANWAGFTTADEYKIFYDIPSSGDFINPRDRIMAMRIFTKFKDIIKEKQHRQKALVIMNSRHAFGYIKQMNDSEFGYIGQNVGGYLFKWLPNQVANVMLHTATPSHLLQNGKWDAAFLCNDNKSVGFSFKNNSFSNDSFDYGQIPAEWGTYQDIFTGMVFLNPLSKQIYCTNHIPNFYDDNYKAIVKTRAMIAGGEDVYNEIQKMWQDMILHPEKFCGLAYDDNFLQPMYQWVDKVRRGSDN